MRSSVRYPTDYPFTVGTSVVVLVCNLYGTTAVAIFNGETCV